MSLDAFNISFLQMRKHGLQSGNLPKQIYNFMGLPNRIWIQAF